MNRANRLRRLLAVTAALAAALAAAGCSTGAGAPDRPAGTTKVRFLTGAGFQGREAPVYVAMEKGWFADAGIDVDVQAGRGTEYNLKLLLAGKAEFASLDITGALIEYANHPEYRDFLLVNALQQKNLACLLALDGSGITTPADLAGKKIGYIEGGVVRTLFGGYAKAAGFDPTTVRWRPAPIRDQAKLLAAGQIQVSSQFVVGQKGVEAQVGHATTMFPYADYLTDLYGVGVGVTRTTATDKADLVRRFNDALLRGLSYAVAHPQEAAQIFANHQKVKAAGIVARAQGEVQALKPYVLPVTGPVGGIDPARMERNIAALQAAGAITGFPGSVPYGDQVVAWDLVPTS